MCGAIHFEGDRNPVETTLEGKAAVHPVYDCPVSGYDLVRARLGFFATVRRRLWLLKPGQQLLKPDEQPTQASA